MGLILDEVMHSLGSPKLAINGGSPALPDVPFEDPGIPIDAAEQVADVVRSGRTCYWGGGPRAQEFESRFAAYVGKQYGFFHQSGSGALLSAIFSTTFRHEGPVVVGSSGFVAAINAVYHNGARPIFLKTDMDTLQASAMDYDPVDAEPSSLLVTHFLGNVADTPRIQQSVKARYVIEDAGQAHGAELDGQPVGHISDIASFAGSHKKLVTAGQGGINVSNQASLIDRMRVYGHHGKSAFGLEAVPGYNLRGGEMEAVLALTSLADLPKRVSARNRTAQMICSVLNSAGIETAVPFSERAKPAWFDVGIILPEEFIPVRERLVEILKAENVPAATYPSLIEIAWVKPWMQANGWWDEWHEEVLQHEKSIWGRVIVLGAQMSPEDGQRCAEAIADILAGGYIR